MGRAVSALLRMTDASTTIYSPECGGWFLRDGTEVMGISMISLLRTSISIPGLLGVDSLLSFRIVNELRQFIKFYTSKAKTYGVLLEQIRDGLFPEWKNVEDNGRLYTAALKKLEGKNWRKKACCGVLSFQPFFALHKFRSNHASHPYISPTHRPGPTDA